MIRLITDKLDLGPDTLEKTETTRLEKGDSVFTLVNDSNALDFNDLSYDGNQADGFHQAKAIPSNTGTPVQFMGSTTGPSFDEKACSALQVTWSVRPQCAKLDINTIGKWCDSNVFEEVKAHGVRELVTDPRLLSPIE